jgi:hypothetical protein
MEGAVSEQDQREVLRASIEGLIEQMKSVTVTTDEEYQFLDGWRRKAKETEKAVDAAFEEERSEKYAAYMKVNDDKNVFKKPLKAALDVVSEKMTAYNSEKEKARRKAEADARALALKQAEDDRLEEAGNLQAMGRADKADELLEKKVTVSSKVVAAAMPEVPAKLGKTAERWTVKVTDKSKFLAFAAVAHASILDCVTVNEAALAALARANKGLTAPGLEVEQKFVPVL